MTYYYRNPQHKNQRQMQRAQVQQEASAPTRSWRGLWTTLAAIAAFVVIIVLVVVAFGMHTVNQLEQEIAKNNPAVEGLLEEHDMSMLDLILLGRELEGASREEVIQRAQEMGLTEDELREFAADSEVRELIDQFLNR